MAIFIDTGPFVAVRNRQDKNHVRAIRLMQDALLGKYGTVYTSDYIIDEIITTAFVRTQRHDIAVNAGIFVIESKRIVKLHVDADIFTKSWALFRQIRDKSLSFTDCTTLVLMEAHRINRIMSFDSDFDAFVTRVS